MSNSRNILEYRKPNNVVHFSRAAEQDRRRYIQRFGEETLEAALRLAKSHIRYQSQEYIVNLYKDRDKLSFILPSGYGALTDRLLTLYLTVRFGSVLITAILIT